MTRDELIELACRVEQLTGRDRGVDGEIAALMTGGVSDKRGKYWTSGGSGAFISPTYTSSIDAAMTLVPEGESWSLREYPGDRSMVFIGCLAESACKSPALALTAAALRALSERAG